MELHSRKWPDIGDPTNPLDMAEVMGFGTFITPDDGVKQPQQ